jgi:hypothetical protein
MRGRFFESQIQPTQKNRKKRTSTRPQLNKEAQDALTAHHRAAAAGYQEVLDGVWAKLDGDAKNVASQFHKSINKVSNDLHMGRQVSLNRHSKLSAWNAFCWKKSQENKENANANGNEGYLYIYSLLTLS